LKTDKKKGAHANKYSVDITQEYRALYKILDTDEQKEYLWLWAGHHTEYDKKLANRKWQP
jgi:hypothetical protein